MANIIKIKRGLSSNLSKANLQEGELAYATDTKKLYISNTSEPINNNTTYSISKSGSTITLTGSDGSTSTVSDSNTTYSAATTSANGLMSSSDKTKLNGIATGAQVNNVVVSTSQPSSGEVWINPNGQTSISSINTSISNINAKLPTTIYTGTLTGGNSVTLSGVKRFLKVYCRVNFTQGPGNVVFEIDTSEGSTPCGGAVMDPFDESSFNSVYSFAGKYNVSTKAFTLYRVGYYVFASHTWSERHGNSSYFAYRIDTYD